MRCGALVLLGVFVGASPAAAQAPVKAVGAVELKDAAGDMGPISTSSGQEPALDVVNLSIRSDGTRLTFAATLKDPPGRFATAPVAILVDADNNPASGTKGMGGGPSGFEYKAELSLCIKYSDKSEACSGGSSSATPTERYGAMNLERFKGDSEYAGSDTVVDSMGFFGRKASVRVPVTGKVVESSIEYADLKLQSRQTIRLLAKERGGSPKDGDGSFPVVLLTLK